MRRLLIVLVLILWPTSAQAQPTPSHAAATLTAMAWCLPPNATPKRPVAVDPATGEEWLSVDADGLDFALMWQPQPTSVNFTNVPHSQDPRIRIAFPNRFERFTGAELTQDEQDLARVFMLMTVGCFSISDVTDAVSS